MNEKESGLRLLQDTLADICRVAELLHLEDNMIRVLSEPRRPADHFTLYVPRDNGDLDILHGWRAKHRALSSGKYRGGFLFHPTAGEEMIVAKSILMTWKQALVGPDEYHRVPYGGAKGGVRCNIDNYSPNEQDRLISDLVKQLDPIIGPGWDEIGPDLKFYPHLIEWFYKYYKERHQQDIQCGAIITGKPPDAGGGIWRPPATGKGLHIVIEGLRRNGALNLSRETPTVISHGFGQVGGNFSLLASKFGLLVTGVCDEFAGIYNPHGLDVKRLQQHVLENKSLHGAPDGEEITPQEILEQPCDILAVNSIEGVLNKGNADKVHTHCIVEGANGPVTREAADILNKKSILIVPGILANAGGVIASYFEVLQEIQGEYFSEERVEQGLYSYLNGGVQRMLQASERFSVPWETGALTASIEYVVRVLRQKHSFLRTKPSHALV